jgi:lysophospholipase L1-like esterase
MGHTIFPEELNDAGYLDSILQLKDELMRDSLMMHLNLALSSEVTPELANAAFLYAAKVGLSFINGNQIYTPVTEYVFETLELNAEVLSLNKDKISELKKNLKRKCQIICIGDSNTFFFMQAGPAIFVGETYPSELMEHVKKDDYNFNLLNVGYPGLTVKKYKEVLHQNILKLERRYVDNVTILSLGLNDIGEGLESGKKFNEVQKEVVEGLEEICECIPANFSHNTRTYVCSIPIFNSDYFKIVGISPSNIEKLNDSVRAMCKKKGLDYISLEGILTKNDYLDSIHLNPSGQKKMAAAIYDAIKEHLRYVSASNMFKI